MFMYVVPVSLDVSNEFRNLFIACCDVVYFLIQIKEVFSFLFFLLSEEVLIRKICII